MQELIYRPQHKPDKDIPKDFVIRLNQYAQIMGGIAQDQENANAIPKHTIIVGQRGMGKTTLLHRVRYQVQQDYPTLIPVVFPEEQYRIRTLYKLWEQVAEYLDAQVPDYQGIAYALEERSDDEDYEELCYSIVKSYADERGHRLLLLLDNFGDLIQKFKKHEQQRLREILITWPGIKILAGSTALLENFYKYDQPFFDFFEEITLPPLKREEVNTLMLNLGNRHETQTVQQIIDNQPGRLDALRILTGGVPRTLALLFSIYLDNALGNSVSDLKTLLDRVTPLYKHRMDELPPQQQELVERLALNWDGMTAQELAQKARMESKAVSAQLNLLVKNHVVNATPGKKKFYQLEERFFNIWYLMHHAPPRQQKRVIWLTRFLEAWCPGDHLANTTTRIIEGMSNNKWFPEYAITMTNALAQADGLDTELREQLVEAARASYKEQVNELPLPYDEVFKLVDYFRKSFYTSNVKETVSKIENAGLPIKEELYLKGIATISTDLDEAENHFLAALQKGNKKAHSYLACIYLSDGSDKAADHYKTALEFGDAQELFRLGLLQYSLGKNKEGTDCITSSIKRDDKLYVDFIQGLIGINPRNVGFGLIQIFEEVEKGEALPSSIYLIHACLWLWIDQPEKATISLKHIKPSAAESATTNHQPNLLLLLLVALAVYKGYHKSLIKFLGEHTSSHSFKIHYYVLMSLLQEGYPDAMKPMPKELEEPISQFKQIVKKLIQTWEQQEHPTQKNSDLTTAV